MPRMPGGALRGVEQCLGPPTLALRAMEGAAGRKPCGPGVAGPHGAVGRTRLCGAERLWRAVAVPCFRSARRGGHTARQLRRGDAVGGTPLKRSPGAPPGLFFAGGVTGRSVSWSDVRCGVRARCAAPRAGREAVVCRCERSESPSHGRRKPWRWRKREARHGKMAWDSG